MTDADRSDEPVITSRRALAFRVAQAFFDNANTGRNASNDELVTDLRDALDKNRPAPTPAERQETAGSDDAAP